MVLIVTPLSRLDQVVASRRPSHVITLLSPRDELPALPSVAHHLRLGVDDIAIPTDGLVAPDSRTVEQVLAFAEGWRGEAPMVVHCWAGISRSTASAFAIACARNPDVQELDIALAMRRASPSAYPNRRIVALADEILNRQGRMLEAVEAMGGNGMAAEGSPFEVPFGR